MYRAGTFLLLGFVATAQAQPTTLTLSCKGTTTQYLLPGFGFDVQPISMGIIVNLTDRTVQGFDYPFDIEPLKIVDVSDTEVRFGGKQETSVISNMVGSINRVTGDVDATWSFIDRKKNKIEPHIRYTLQCRPAQRMF
jgi:hypothetical protein